MIVKKWIYSDSERSTLHRQRMGLYQRVSLAAGRRNCLRNSRSFASPGFSLALSSASPQKTLANR